MYAATFFPLAEEGDKAAHRLLLPERGQPSVAVASGRGDDNPLIR